ncbi:MAG: M24 family metallopeptidase [Nitrososphaerota archaeon]
MSLTVPKYNLRVKNLLELLELKNLDAIIITKAENFFYFLGAVSTISTKKNGPVSTAVFCKDVPEVHIYVTEDEFDRISDELSSNGISVAVSSCGFESSPTVEAIKYAKKHCKGNSVGVDDCCYLDYASLGLHYEDLSSKILEIRMVKDKSEIDSIITASNFIMDATFDVIRDLYKLKNESEILARFEELLRSRGINNYGTIGLVSSGNRTKYVHGYTTNREIVKDLPIILNIAATYNFYYSDFGRTIIPSNTESIEPIKKYYDILVHIRGNLLDLLRPGNSVEEIMTNIAEEYRRESLLLTHPIGRGIGLDLVEPPFLVPGYKSVLKEGEVISIHPWFKIADEKFGLKIVDTVLITNSFPKLVTEFPTILYY